MAYFFFLLLCSLTCTACVQNIRPQDTTIALSDFKVELKTYKDSLRGRFLLGLLDYTKMDQLPLTSELAVVDESGKIIFQRTFRHFYKAMISGDLKPVGADGYGYFLGILSRGSCPSTYHFLDRDFRDSFPRPVPDRDQELDGHEVAQAKNGNYFFLFYRHDLREGIIRPEIQEWNSAGAVVFSWRLQDHLKIPLNSDNNDPMHLNSIDFDSDGGLILGLFGSSSILKIAYPSGEILWQMLS